MARFRVESRFEAALPATLVGVVAAMLASLWLYPAALSRPALPGIQGTAPTQTHDLPRLTPHGPRFDMATEPQLVPEAPPPRAPDHEIAKLGARPTRASDPIRQRYLEARDLHALMGDLLPAAAAGERTSQYHLYLVLSRCQTYLRMDAESARELNERTLLSMNGNSGALREHEQSEYWRCQGFAGADLGALRAAMGSDTPGAEVEYASIWFQRAFEAGYPPALTEAALRLNLLSETEREGLLGEAVSSGEPDVYWQLFLASPGGIGEPISADGLAWLILACRSGQDCSSDADWFRNVDCLEPDAPCSPSESAIGHYWYRASEADREAAYAMASRIERSIAVGRTTGLPWPELAKRNIYANRFARENGG